jgi:hypothetical protein
VHDTVIGRHPVGLLERKTDDGHYVNARDVLEPIEMLDAKGAGTGDRDAKGPVQRVQLSGSSTMCPIAVLDAGT